MEEIESLQIDVDIDVPPKSNAIVGPKSENNNFILRRLKSVKTLQRWWKTLHHNISIRREKLQQVHIATFVVGLCIRSAVVAYLCYILSVVVDTIVKEQKLLDLTNAEDNLERAVLRDLLLGTFAGYSNIVVCRCGLGG